MILVYKHQLELGLRFPLHPFIEQVLVHYNINLAQFTPQEIRKMLGFIWIAEFFGHELTLSVFRAVFKLKASNSQKRWWNIEFIN